jgi:biotin carboxyl carrier protein
MTFDIEVNGEIRSVRVESLGAAGEPGGRFRLWIGDGEPIEVDCRRTDLGLAILYPQTGRTVDAAVVDRGGGDWLVQLPHVGIVAAVDGRRFKAGRAADAAASGEQRITAPMPGRIVRVLVQPGDEVAARQGLIVIEAMKMENELTSQRAGRVREVAVAEGVSVEAGRLLVIVE